MQFPPLFFDLYELTMAQGYLESERASWEGCFHLYFRRLPKGSRYALAAGLEPFLKGLHDLHWNEASLEYLSSLKQADGRPLFQPSFLKQLANWNLELTIEAMAEGTPCFPNEPLLRVEGPLWQAQLLESAALNIINFSTLIASHAAVIVKAADSASVLEFGMRRAQGPDGSLLASRSSYLAGCHSTSNVAAGQAYGIPVVGTMAHSWVLAFPTEEEAFEQFLNLYPGQTVLLLDTYDVSQGLTHAIQLMRKAKASGLSILGVRLDSGDLATWSETCREALDMAGFPEVKIIVSNELTADRISVLRTQQAPIDVFAVGTDLSVSVEDPHLTGVYKLAAVRPHLSAPWSPCAKRGSEGKPSLPGPLTVRRYVDSEGNFSGDLLVRPNQEGSLEGYPLKSPSHRKTWEGSFHNLLSRVMERGQLIQPLPSLASSRSYCEAQRKAWDTQALFPYLIGVESSIGSSSA